MGVVEDGPLGRDESGMEARRMQSIVRPSVFGPAAYMGRVAAVLAAAAWALPAVAEPPASPAAEADACDRLAAHPYDPDRVVPGVRMAVIEAEPAAAACRDAVAQHPGVARFEYQLGRALQAAGQPEDAVRWIARAAARGYRAAQYSLGRCHEGGLGVAQSDAEAVHWFRLAAEQEHALARVFLGFMHAQGRGVAQSDTEAVRWYRLAAEQGNAVGRNNLGVMLRAGRGVEPSDPDAVHWFRLAAEQGYAPAQANLAFMYAEGRGVAQNDAEAVRWSRLAALQGSPRARADLEAMCRRGVAQACD